MGIKLDDTVSVVDYSARIRESYEPSDTTIARLESIISDLKSQLEDERRLRFKAEFDAERFANENRLLCQKKKRRTKVELDSVKDDSEEFNEFKLNGVRKARPAQAIRSYEDFAAIQQYFWSRGKIRDWMLWTVGVSLGLRISDLFSLKIKSILNEDLTFRKYICVIEEKTSKLNSCLITESVVGAVRTYFDSIEWKFSLEDYLFKSRKTNGKMYEEYGWKILSDAGKALSLPIVIGSHTMRKSFANIAACVDKSCIDMNTITKIQGLLNHSDQKVTMRYLGTFAEMFDRARIAVSDFVLGKTDVHELIAGNSHSIDDVISKLEEIETKL